MADLPIVLREMVGLSPGLEENYASAGESVVAPGSIMADRNPRNRFKPRLQAKGISSLSNIPEVNRRNMRPLEINRRISDLKEEPGNGISLTPLIGTETQTRLQFTPTTIINPTAIRRDSISSNASSFYYSMKSADVSRRSSQGRKKCFIFISSINRFIKLFDRFYQPLNTQPCYHHHQRHQFKQCDHQ